MTTLHEIAQKLQEANDGHASPKTTHLEGVTFKAAEKAHYIEIVREGNAIAHLSFRYDPALEKFPWSLYSVYMHETGRDSYISGVRAVPEILVTLSEVLR